MDTGSKDVYGVVNSKFRPIAEFLTIQEGYDHCRLHKAIPFVVRNCAEFIPASHEQICQQIRFEGSVRGYNELGTHQIRGLEAFDMWTKNTLKFDIVDSCSSRGSLLLPETIRALNIANDVDSVIWLAYVLTAGAVQGKVHIDPPFGSGWQYLSCGSKCWTIIDRDFFIKDAVVLPPPVVKVIAAVPAVVAAEVVLFEVVATKRFSVVQAVVQAALVVLDIVAPDVIDAKITIVPLDVISAVKETLLSELDITSKGGIQQVSSAGAERVRYPGQYIPAQDYDVEAMATQYPQELYRVVLNATDFLSCPEDWPHSVYTDEKTIGLSGYMKYKLSGQVAE